LSRETRDSRVEIIRNSGVGTSAIAMATRKKEQNESFEYFEKPPSPFWTNRAVFLDQNASIPPLKKMPDPWLTPIKHLGIHPV
jgi:hypothetical protein